MCVIVGSYSSRKQEQSQEQRYHSAFFYLFHFRYAVCCCCVPVSQRKLLTLWQSRYHNSSRTSRSSFCGSYERCRCFCVCSCVRIMCACHPEHNERQFQPTLALNFKSIRAVQHRYNSNSSSSGTAPAVNFATVTYIGTPVLPLFNLRHPLDFKPTTSRRGTLYVYGMHHTRYLV